MSLSLSLCFDKLNSPLVGSILPLLREVMFGLYCEETID